MKKYILSFALLFAVLCLQAQTKWTLRQCVDYAVQNNIDLRRQSLGVNRAEINLSTSKNSRLPDLNASIGQNFSFGRSTLQNNTSESVNTSRTSFSIGTEIPIFTGFRIPNQIKADEFSLQAATEGLRKATENLELQVASLFLEVLLNKEILKAYQEQAALSKLQVEKTQIMLDAGKIPATQLYDIKATAAQDELNVTTADNNLALSLLNLSQALNLSVTEGFDVVVPDLGDAIDNNISSIIPPDQVYQMALGVKPHIKEAELLLESNKKLLKVAQSGYWPTLNFDASYGTSYTKVFGKTGLSFSRQLSDYGSEAIGLSLRIPIFNRFQTRNRVRAARLDIEDQNLVLDNTKLALYKEIQQAYQKAVSAQSEFNSTGRAYEAAEESFKYARERYDIGKSTVFEYNEAQTKLLTSKSKQIQAKYDFIFRAKILDFYQGKQIDIQ
jgi:outer membrane protein